MSPRRFYPLLLILLCACAFTPVLFAQTTGDIVGDVTVAGGKSLSGVSVAAFGPALQGSRVATTDGAGHYRLTLLPPGEYNVTFTGQGFSPVTRNAIVVSLSRTTTLDVTLQPTMQEQVKVVGEAPVDTTSTTVGTNLSKRAIETLPTSRSYTSIVQVAPGTSTDASNNNPSQSSISVYGSSGAENTYYIDGINTTNVEYGFQGKDLNYEFIQEVDVKTGGYEAEHGRSTGGIINVITKSGGNEFHGDIFGYNDNDSRQSSAEPVVSINGTTAGFTREDYGADLGGYFVKDKLWFFGAYDRVNDTTNTEIPSGALAGQIAGVDTTRNLGAFKLTYKMTANHSLIFSFFQDPRTDTGAINDVNHPVNGDPITFLGRQKLGGKDYAVRYEGILGSKWLLSGQVSRHQEENTIGPESAAGDAIEYIDHRIALFQTNGFGLIQNKDFKRDFVGGALTRFLGHNEIKFGAEYEKQTANVFKRMSGGQQVEIFDNTVNPLKPIYRHFYWTTKTAALTDPGGPATSALDATVEHKNTTFYLQDRWAVRPNLTVNAGLRWDRQEVFGATGQRQMDLKRDYAPRLGIIWDPKNDHRSKFYASWGRFYEQLPMDLVIRSYAFERQPRIINYDAVSRVPDTAAESDFGFPNPPVASTILGGATEPTDPNIKGQYIREAIVGWEREMLPDLTLGVKVIERSYRRVIEDFLCDVPSGLYCIGNPRHGIMSRIYDLASFSLPSPESFPAPRPKRKYDA
ncbi:MAG TPA: TonB-dependent receptor, partial [Candidatus Polarisedimenticolia bacterium]|nr:TonB-dependent receptor [Candidatus Polarisedimenticolia bacterium]